MIYTHIGRNEMSYTCIELANGMKVNCDFFWYAVEIGILNMNDRVF